MTKEAKDVSEISQAPRVDALAETLHVSISQGDYPLVPGDETGLVFVEAELFTEEPRVVIGTIQGVIVDPYLMDELFDRDVHDACDEESDDLERLAWVMYSPESHTDFHPDIEDLFEYPHGRILYIHELTIEPEHRGKGLSLPFLERMFDLAASNCNAIVVFPKPEGTEVGGPEAARLARHFERLGFFPLGETGYWARDQELRHDRVKLDSR